MVAGPNGGGSGLRTDWLIVGAGYAGSVLAERIASQRNERVLVVDRRSHIAGNAYDYVDEHGVLVHKYGPHIFHTNSSRVWEYLSQFTEWHPYEHRVLALVEGKLVPVPFNLNSLGALWPKSAAARLEERLVNEYGAGVKVPILQMLGQQDREIARLARYVYDQVFHGYTVKQWNLRPEDLDASVTARVPVHISRDDRYFQDRYQAMPKRGYAEMFRRMLSHPNIALQLNTDYRDVIGQVRYRRLIYTGQVDEYFGYAHGPLPYRSLRFETRHEPGVLVQPCAQLNYPNGQAFTRTTEFKHMTGQTCEGTAITAEYPQAHVSGQNEPYYPIPMKTSQDRHMEYVRLAEQEDAETIFVGRLADYRYYNMDQVVARALNHFECLSTRNTRTSK